MEDKKVLLSVKDLIVKFHVRGRVLTAIRGVSLDIYENESIAIVGESGSGKSVFTKTFAGMLDSNGFIDQGRLIFNDEELADTVVVYDDKAKKKVSEINAKLDELSKYEFGAATYKKMLELESEKRQKCTLSDEEKAKGVIASSAGNHAQGVALGAKMTGIKATIVMPETAPLAKVTATKSYGAEVVLNGAVYDDAYAKAVEKQKETGAGNNDELSDQSVAG